MTHVMDIHEILKFLPHRYPFVLIDKVLEIEVGKSLRALKNVTMNEAYFAGHFPDYPVMPGVMILEALAQAGAVLAYKTNRTSPRDALYYFAGIDKARFRRVVIPGDQLILEVKVIRAKQDVWKLQGSAYVDQQLACDAEFMSVGKKYEE